MILTRNPLRDIKRNFITGTLAVSFFACLLTLIYIVYLTVYSDFLVYYYYEDFVDFIFAYGLGGGFGTVISLGVITFISVIGIIGAYLILGANLIRLSELKFEKAETARFAAIFFILGVCTEIIGLFARFFDIVEYVTVGNYQILLSTIFYTTSFILIYQVFKSLKTEGIVTKQSNFTFILAPIVYFVKTVALIVMTYLQTVSFAVFNYIIVSLTIIYYALLTIGFFLVYTATTSIEESQVQKMVKGLVQPSIRPIVQQNHRAQSQEQIKKDHLKLFCTKCGRQADIDDAFCRSCGNKIKV